MAVTNRGVVAEAGFTRSDDHIAISNVLSRRWAQVEPQLPGISFVKVARQYMRGMQEGVEPKSNRQAWVRSLPYEMPATNMSVANDFRDMGFENAAMLIRKPDSWPGQLEWKRYIRPWNEVLANIGMWSLGGKADKCPQAMHWGAPTGIDRARAVAAGWEIVDCGDTANIFYSVPGRPAPKVSRYEL